MFSDPQISALMQKLQGKMKKPDMGPTGGATEDMADVPQEEPEFKPPQQEFKAPREEPKKQPTADKAVLQKKDEATKLFKDKKFEQAYTL